MFNRIENTISDKSLKKKERKKSPYLILPTVIPFFSHHSSSLHTPHLNCPTTSSDVRVRLPLPFPLTLLTSHIVTNNVILVMSCFPAYSLQSVGTNLHRNTSGFRMCAHPYLPPSRTAALTPPPSCLFLTCLYLISQQRLTNLEISFTTFSFCSLAPITGRKFDFCFIYLLVALF